MFLIDSGYNFHIQLGELWERNGTFNGLPGSRFEISEKSLICTIGQTTFSNQTGKVHLTCIPVNISGRLCKHLLKGCLCVGDWGQGWEYYLKLFFFHVLPFNKNKADVFWKYYIVCPEKSMDKIEQQYNPWGWGLCLSVTAVSPMSGTYVSQHVCSDSF